MREQLRVSAWVGIRDDCDLECNVTSDQGVEFTFGGRSDGFDIVFQYEALKSFVQLASETLARPLPED